MSKGVVVKSKNFPEVSGTYSHCCSSICSKLIGGTCVHYNRMLLEWYGLKVRTIECVDEHGGNPYK